MSSDLQAWEPRLRELCVELRRAARSAAREGLGAVQRPVAEGAGDVTYALDAATEEALGRWLERTARRGPLSLFSEDAGWRHRGPEGGGTGTRELTGFDHGGPRIVVDPVDGTRNLMADLRSAWTVVAAAPPGTEQPRLSEVELGLVAELPDSRAARYRLLSARLGAGARIEERRLEDDFPVHRGALVADTDDRPDHGYFSIFRYTPAQRPALAELEARFFARLAEREGADLRHCFDDQYISNGGQLALLSLGTYRMVADLRAHLAEGSPTPVTTSKPYDCAGAVLVAREAGCVVTDPGGEVLDFPLDATTPVSFVGWANAATARRLAPHLLP